jgi:hypothetical protein
MKEGTPPLLDLSSGGGEEYNLRRESAFSPWRLQEQEKRGGIRAD